MLHSNGPWIRPTEDDMKKFKGRGDTVDSVEKLLRKSFLDWVRYNHDHETSCSAYKSADL